MNTIQLIPINQIVINRFQPAGVKDEVKMLEIAESLKQYQDNGAKGLLQVPTARMIDSGKYELAFGAHRFYAFEHNAAEDPFFSEMPLLIHDNLTDIDMFKMMGLENLKRRDIGVIEEANIFHTYMNTFGLTSVAAAQDFGKTEEYIRGAIRLLNLPEPAQKMVREGKLNKSQARDLLVAEKLGGSELVEEIIHEIETDPDDANPTETISTVIRMSDKTKFLDRDAAWYSAKKFPVKNLPDLTKAQLSDFIQYADGVSVGEPVKLINDISVLIASGMEVTDAAFPMLSADGLERLRILVNPPQCEKCVFHAVLDGQHICGLRLCQERKVAAWKGKEVEDQVKKVGVPMYQKSDGAYIQLNPYDAGDKKLWNTGDAGLRLLPAQHMWNNFEGVGQNLKVVLVGKEAEARLKKEETSAKREETKRSNEAKEREINQVKREYLARFMWEVVSPAFACMLDGITNMDFLIFNRAWMIDWVANDTNLPDGVDEGKLIDAALKAKKADGLNSLRRLNMAFYIDKAHDEKFDYDKVITAKQSILNYAKNFQRLSDMWGVKLPKDFMGQATRYQAELDAAIKGI